VRTAAIKEADFVEFELQAVDDPGLLSL